MSLSLATAISKLLKETAEKIDRSLESQQSQPTRPSDQISRIHAVPQRSVETWVNSLRQYPAKEKTRDSLYEW